MVARCFDVQSLPEAAFEYASWFASPEIARETVLKGGGSSGRQSLLHEPSILATNPQYKALADSFAFYAPWPQTPAASYIVEVPMVQTGTKIFSSVPSQAGINQDLGGFGLDHPELSETRRDQCLLIRRHRVGRQMTIDEKVMPRSRRQQARGITGDGIAAAPSWKRRRSNDLVRQERRTAVFLAVPAAVVAIGVIVAPLCYAGWLSLHRTPLVGGSVFAGLTEYDEVLHSGAFWSVFG